MSTITVDGIEYVPKENVSYDNVIVRADRAGVFAGQLKERTGDEVVLCNARRLWYWEGAASLSQLAREGVSKPEMCKFPVTLPELIVLGVIEIIPMSDEAKASIDSVPVWSK